MNKANWHHYQILTKRAKRLFKVSNQLNWEDHIWMGVTIENSNYIQRMDNLKRINAKIKFISFEPLIGSVGKIDLDNIDWVIVGGESGPGARPVEEEWVMEIQEQCDEQNVPFFFKQWGGVNKKKTGRILNGQIWNEMPQLAFTWQSISINDIV